jgi:hypothetical protein
MWVWRKELAGGQEEQPWDWKSSMTVSGMREGEVDIVWDVRLSSALEAGLEDDGLKI